MEQEGMYQAGGNVSWLNVIPVHGGFGARCSASVSDLLSIIDQLWLCSSAVDVHGKLRLLFPCILDVGLERPDEASEPELWEQSLVVLAGVPLLQAWYVAVGRAIRERDEVWLKLLWDAGLGVTLRFRSGLASIKDSPSSL